MGPLRLKKLVDRLENEMQHYKHLSFPIPVSLMAAPSNTIHENFCLTPSTLISPAIMEESYRVKVPRRFFGNCRGILGHPRRVVWVVTQPNNS